MVEFENLFDKIKSTTSEKFKKSKEKTVKQKGEILLLKNKVKQ